ncbi:MAG: hypothetical protein CBC48_20440 [bacterium TMED88]|nr:hypothetical protein [Deltaproteobacteria bacterium]OUV21529.1 MAG: hypothetical protein CBC48_20440 [bacterium TMED88]
MTSPKDPGFPPREQALLQGLVKLDAGQHLEAVQVLQTEFDQHDAAGEIGQIIHAHGLYRGLHSTLAAIGAEILDAEGRPLSDLAGFTAVTDDEGGLHPRKDFPAL